MKLADYIKQYRTEHNISGRRFAEMVGCSNAYISQIENGKQTNFSVDFLNAVAKATGVPMKFMLSQIDNVTAELNTRSPAEAESMIPVPDLSFLEEIPLLGSSACGLPIQANREYDYIDIGPAKRADFALTAEGRSMVNAGILDGSIVLFEETERVDNGTIAAVTVGDSTTIKKFYQYGDTVILRPCNPEFQDQEYSGDDLEMIHVFGRAVGSFNKY